MGPLLPKLRGELAKFLNEGSLARLSALTPGHLCRFAVRVLALHRLEAFLGTLDSATTLPKKVPMHLSVVTDGFSYRSTLIHQPGQPKPGFAYPNASLRHSKQVVQES